MADNLKATPRNELLGLLSDVMYGGLDWMKDPRRSQQMQGLAGLLESTGIPQTTQRLAYGEPLTNIGRANVPLLKPETADALMNVAPFAPVAGKVGKTVGRMAGAEINAAMTGKPTMSLLGAITPKPKLLDVYHGTPHTLPPTPRNPLGEFDASKIGTGEGAQSFGHGIYTAENPLVAKDYQFMEQNWFDTSKAKYKGKSIDSWYEQAQKDQERAFRTKDRALERDATARLAYWENIMTHNHPEKVLQQFTDPEYGWDAATNYAKSIDLSKFEGIPRSGNLYKVDLPDEKIATMLDWDKPLSEQSKYIQDVMTKIGMPLNKTGKEAYEGIGYEMGRQKGSTRSTVVPFNPAEASNFLQEQGIAGIKYLDQFSREAGQGTRNFVIFPKEEKSMTILERNGVRAFPQEVPYPQQAALDLAQQRAALPVSEGGLGLPANNTAMDRAKAMGFDVDNPLYHATDVDFTSINPSVKGKYGAGVYTATTPKYAEIYAQGENARTLPLMARGKLASDDERIAIADQMLEQYQAKEGMDVPLWKKMTKEELANRGYTGVSIGKERLIFNPSDLRSRFAAFDPFRKDVATATAMGVALPDLLAAEPTPQPQSSGLLFPY